MDQMPGDFSPTFYEADGLVKWEGTATLPNGALLPLNLAYQGPRNERLDGAMCQSIWQTIWLYEHGEVPLRLINGGAA